MTIKRYEISIEYGEVPGDVESSMEESFLGAYIKREDVLEWLRASIRKEYIYEIPRLLIEELQ